MDGRTEGQTDRHTHCKKLPTKRRQHFAHDKNVSQTKNYKTSRGGKKDFYLNKGTF